MKKIIGVILIIAGVGNMIQALGMASDGGPPGDVGGKFLFALFFLGVGAWMISSTRKTEVSEIENGQSDRLIKIAKDNIQATQRTTGVYEDSNEGVKEYIEKVPNEKLNEIVQIQNRVASLTSGVMQEKKDMFLLLYKTCEPDAKAVILNTWYQCSHNNPFIDEIEKELRSSKNPIYPFYPNTSDKLSNLKVLKNIITSEHKIKKEVETFLLNKISTSIFKFEIDRLLYISFALNDLNPVAVDSLLETSKKNWVNYFNKPFCPYLRLIDKTKIDVLILKEQFAEALKLSEYHLKVISSDNETQFHWLTYQYVKVVIELGQNGYPSQLWSQDELEEMAQRHSELAFVKDNLDSLF